MDGTVEQPAHTNDKTLTGRQEVVFHSVSLLHFSFSLLVFFFFMLLLF